MGTVTLVLLESSAWRRDESARRTVITPTMQSLPPVPSNNQFSPRFFALTRSLIWALVLLGCADGATGPRGPLHLLATPSPADTTLSAAPGQLVPLPIQVTVENTDGTPLRGAFLEWKADGGGSVEEASHITNDDGAARAGWRLGTNASKPQLLEVTVVTTDGRSSGLQLRATAIPSRVASMVASPDTVKVRVGDTATVTLRARDEFGNQFSPKTAHLESRDTSIVRISPAGQLSIVGRGLTHVIAHADAVVDSVTVNATQVVQTIIVNPDTLRFHSLSLERSATVVLLDDRGLEVRDSTPTVRIGDTTVTKVLDATPLTVVSQAVGVTRIRLVAGSVQRDVVVEVGQQTALLDVSPISLRMSSLGDTARLHVNVLDSANVPIAGATVTYASGDTTIASVSAAGLITARANGLTRIAVTSNSVTDSVPVRVSQRAARIQVLRDSLYFDALGATQPLPAIVVDSLGNVVQNGGVSYSSADQTVATIAADGSVKAVGPGATSVVVRAGTDSAVVITSVTQKVARIATGGDSISFDALGARQRLVAVPLDSLGSIVAGAPVSMKPSDTTVAQLIGDTIVSRGNGATSIRLSSGSAQATVSVTVAQVATQISATRTDTVPIVNARIGDPLPVQCRALDGNGFVVPGTPSVTGSAAATFSGSACGALVAQRSGIDTLRFTMGQASTTMVLPVAIVPNVSDKTAELLPITGIPTGRYPWAPTLHRRADGVWELYAALYDSLTWLSGDLHRFVSSDGVHFQHDELVLSHDTTSCALTSSGIENVAVVPRADGTGSRLYFSAGSFDCYGWQVFSAVSPDNVNWTMEDGPRLSNGGTLPPNAPVYAPWPVGEGMDVSRLPDGEWQMLVGGYEHLTPYEDKFQIVEWRSPDQLNWQYQGPVLTTRQMPPGGQSTIYSPNVNEFAPGLYRLVFSGDNRGTPGARGRIWSAVSTDRAHWQLEGELLGDPSVSYYYASLVDGRLVTIMVPTGAPLPEGHLATVTVAMP